MTSLLSQDLITNGVWFLNKPLFCMHINMKGFCSNSQLQQPVHCDRSFMVLLKTEAKVCMWKWEPVHELWETGQNEKDISFNALFFKWQTQCALSFFYFPHPRTFRGALRLNIHSNGAFNLHEKCRFNTDDNKAACLYLYMVMLYVAHSGLKLWENLH